jgi:hypothetical protein
LISEPTYKKELIEKGFSEYAEIGVPQGAATSCGLSTLNLKELFKRFEDGLSMYADDGTLASDSENPKTPDLTIKEAGVAQNYEKSSWVKKDGIWLTSLKFLGLEFIPANVSPLDGSSPAEHPRLRGATRNGAKLEFTERYQFLCFLSSWFSNEENLESFKLHDSRHLDYTPTTIGNLLTYLYKVFSSHDPMDKLGLLFSSPIGPTVLACIYNDSEYLQEPSDNRLLYRSNSWVRKRYASYIYEMTSNTHLDFLNLVLDAFISNTKEHISENYIFKDTITPQGLEKELSDLVNLKYFLNCNGYSETGILALKSLFKFPEPQQEVIKKEIELLKSKSLYDEYREIRIEWKNFLRLLRLDIFNASSFACDDLLRWLEKGLGVKSWKNRTVLYTKVQSLNLTDKEANKLKFEFEDKKDELRKRLLKRRRKELRNTYKESQNENSKHACITLYEESRISTKGKRSKFIL